MWFSYQLLLLRFYFLCGTAGVWYQSFSLEEKVVMHAGQNDDVAEWDGWPRREKQRVDETDGHRPQGEETPRIWVWICSGSSYQPVSFFLTTSQLFNTHFRLITWIWKEEDVFVKIKYDFLISIFMSKWGIHSKYVDVFCNLCSGSSYRSVSFFLTISETISE